MKMGSSVYDVYADFTLSDDSDTASLNACTTRHEKHLQTTAKSSLPIPNGTLHLSIGSSAS